MFHRSRWGYLCILVVMALAPFTGALSAPAAIGVVDRQALQKDYIGYKSFETRMQQYVKVRETIRQALLLGFGLSPNDYKEYERLTKYEIVIDAERVATFQDVAKKNVLLYKALYEKEATQLTDEEKAQLEKFEANYKTTKAIYDERVGKLQQEIMDEKSRLVKVITEQEAQAIEKAARQKKLDIVLNRSLQTENDVLPFVLWGGVDISGDVVKLLNAEFKETLLDAPPAPATVPAPPAAK